MILFSQGRVMKLVSLLSFDKKRYGSDIFTLPPTGYKPDLNKKTKIFFKLELLKSVKEFFGE